MAADPGLAARRPGPGIFRVEASKTSTASDSGKNTRFEGSDFFFGLHEGSFPVSKFRMCLLTLGVLRTAPTSSSRKISSRRRCHGRYIHKLLGRRRGLGLRV